MGCGASSVDASSGQPQSKPVASVYPQQQTNRPPPKQAPVVVDDESSDEEAEPVELNEDLLKNWMEMEKEIQKLESKSVNQSYGIKAEEVNHLQIEIKNAEQQLRQLEAQTRKEYQDVVNLGQNASVKQMMSQMQFDQQMAKEKEEYMEALNKQEIATKELNAKKKRLEQLMVEQDIGKGDLDKLKDLVSKQDKLLMSVFDNKYGSELEMKLEGELDMLLERQQRILIAKYKWHNARVLLHHATNQLAFSVRRWGDVSRIHPTNLAALYQSSAETRNNLIAASQNITSAQRYLHTITFPYCTPSEMQTLNTAITNIFNDMRSPQRHQHAMQCYVTTHRRAAALIQWFDQVIKNTILKDLEVIGKTTQDKKRELRAERIRLIKEKIKLKDGKEVTAEYSERIASPEPELELDDELTRVMEADAVSMAGDLAGDVSEGTNSATDDAVAPTPLPSNELAPPPDTSDLFGNIEDLKRQHQEQMIQMEKSQQVNKARADQDLQEKLALRKKRRTRIAQQEAEAQALMAQS
ncbi:uncharacterized protein LOC144447481 [Glandiceps talaboti]